MRKFVLVAAATAGILSLSACKGGEAPAADATTEAASTEAASTEAATAAASEAPKM